MSVMRTRKYDIVERVEQLGPEVQRVPFGEADALLDQDVEILVSGHPNIGQIPARFPKVNCGARRNAFGLNHSAPSSSF
jgi:hypothetical protein